MTDRQLSNRHAGVAAEMSHLPERLLLAAAVIMITGAVIGFVAPSLNEAPPFVTADVSEALPAIAGNPAAWQWANGLILAASILTALGLVPITLRFTGSARPWAWTALVAFGFSAAFSAINRLIEIGVTTWAAQQYPHETAVVAWEAFQTLGFGPAFVFLAFAALALYGIAMIQAGARGPGWAFAAVGVLGVLVELVGAGIPAYVFLATAALGVAAWKLDLGPDDHE